MLNLKESGFLGDFEGKRYLLNRKSLLNRWIYGYAEKLKPKLFLGSFSGSVEKIKSTSLLPYNCLMGAELVALNEKLFDSKKISIYSDSLPLDFVKKFRLSKVENGDISIYKVPWNWETLENNELIEVPKLLVYADLMASNEPRSIEVAEVIYEKYLAEYIENNYFLPISK
ncbi:type IV toxin-antitoxin system AbiEi family antitoxin [bacterium]|nr:type IV toxin-antitoxin system AbiEi family antitoxin [bacterium]